MSKKKGALIETAGDLDGMDLGALAALMNAEHGAAQQAALTAYGCAEVAREHAIRCGQVLLAVKKRLGVRGGLYEWIKDNASFAESTARKYMAETQKSLDGYRYDRSGIAVDRALLMLEAPPESEEEESPPEGENATPGANGEAEGGLFKDDQQAEETAGDESPESTDEPAPPPQRYPHSDLLVRWLKQLQGPTLTIRVELGGIKTMLADKDKWNWNDVKDYLLPQLADLERIISEFRKELKRAAE